MDTWAPLAEIHWQLSSNNLKYRFLRLQRVGQRHQWPLQVFPVPLSWKIRQVTVMM